MRAKKHVVTVLLPVLAVACLTLTGCHSAPVVKAASDEKGTESTQHDIASSSTLLSARREQVYDSIQQQAPSWTGMNSQDWESFRSRIENEPDLACRMSYEQTAAAFKAGPPKVDTGEFPPISLAPFEVFMQDCRKQPVMVQRCQVFQYVVHRYGACMQARQEYDLQLRAAAMERRRTQ